MAGFFGFLNGLDPSSPAPLWLAPPDSDSVSDAKDAASQKLAAAMRQQSPNVPPAPGADTFDQRFQNAGWLMNQVPPDVPLPQPRPASAPGPGAPMNINPAALPPNAAPVQGPAPPAAQPAPQASSGPGLMDRITAALANFGPGGRQGGFLGALGGSIQGAATGQRLDPLGQQNQTVQALTSRGIAPDLAQLISRDPQTLNQLLPLMMGINPWKVEKRNVMGIEQLVAYNPNNPSQSMIIKPPTQSPIQSAPTQGGPPQLQSANVVSQNGHVYQRQSDGSWQAIR